MKLVMHGNVTNKKKYRSNMNLLKTVYSTQEMTECIKCGNRMLKSVVQSYSGICPFCGEYFRLSGYERIALTIDEGTFTEFDGDKTSKNILSFPGYDEKLREYQQKSGLNEAVITGVGAVLGFPAAIAVLDSHFMMGSMGSVVGEKIVNLAEHATEKKLPLLIFSASGGARMQEGMFSLIQMARCSAAIKKHGDKGLLFISILTHPTTGGVSASFAMQGDIIIAEPKALIGFAGRRVIEQTIREDLPETSRQPSFYLKRGSWTQS